MYDQIASFQALCAAAQKAAKGKRRKPGAAAFLANLETNVLRLERELQQRTWRPGPYTVMEVHEPKRRRVSAAPFRDRVGSGEDSPDELMRSDVRRVLFIVSGLIPPLSEVVVGEREHDAVTMSSDEYGRFVTRSNSATLLPR